jgi:hypothetical protein
METTMARHHDKLISDARATVAAVGQPARRTEPRSMDEVDKMLRGFGLSAAAVRQVRNAWQEDVSLARSAGYDEGYGDGQDSAY